MRHFFCLLYISSAMLSLWPVGEYSPFPAYDSGTALLTEDLSPESRKTRLHIIKVQSKKSMTAGVSLYRDVWITPPEEVHYTGEIVSVSFKRKGMASVSLAFTGSYGRRINHLRSLIMSTLRYSFGLLGDPGILLEALLLGKTDRARSLCDIFRKAGVSHLLALSGLHLGIVSALIYLILKPLLPCCFRGPVILIFLCFYSWLIGMKHSFIRAVLMYAIINALNLSRMKPAMIKVLLISALLQGILWPEAVGSWSYILSYGAMGGILLFSCPCIIICKRVLPDIVALPLGVSWAAQSIVIPLALPAFGWVELSGLFAGLILTPLVALYIWAGLLMIPVLLFLPRLALMGGWFFSFLYSFMVKTALLFGRFPPFYWETMLGKLLFFLMISVIITVLSIYIIKEWYFGRKNSQIELRFAIGDKGAVRDDGIRPSEKMGAEFPDKQRSQGADN